MTFGIPFLLLRMVNERFYFYFQNAWEVYPLIFVFAFTAYLGFNFVLLFIKSFGAVTTVTGCISSQYNSSD